MDRMTAIKSYNILSAIMPVKTFMKSTADLVATLNTRHNNTNDSTSKNSE